MFLTQTEYKYNSKRKSIIDNLTVKIIPKQKLKTVKTEKNWKWLTGNVVILFVIAFDIISLSRVQY